ncbi:MAG: hypothetical protein A2219_03155 [Elusimicrobia bacterium RIFOXYA2_FULL_50_26]|nr:MAG: hypothetical protein A2219_03155 [Elusimicrobia bacterium RIFOXYA2_FULL_50_26]OGS24937.1 MAG: hypothetical protein A2314_07870 [Elusimicrobia bacterium RIFOXYB2_FULL_50_12]
MQLKIHSNYSAKTAFTDCIVIALFVIAKERSDCGNLDVASDEKRDCRALWARNDDDNFKMLKRHASAKASQ